MLQTDAPAFVELSPSASKSSKLNRYSDEEKEFHREEWKKSGLLRRLKHATKVIIAKNLASDDRR